MPRTGGTCDLPIPDEPYFHESLDRLLQEECRHTALRLDLVLEEKRACCVRWLLEASRRLRFIDDTKHLAVNIFDTFLAASSRPIEYHFNHSSTMPLIGTACLLAAAKFAERQDRIPYPLCEKLVALSGYAVRAQLTPNPLRALHVLLTCSEYACS